MNFPLILSAIGSALGTGVAGMAAIGAWEKAFLSYKVDIKTVDENAPAFAKATAGKKDFSDLSIDDQKRFLLKCLDKNHLYVNYSEIDNEEYGVSKEDKRLNQNFYEK